MAIQLQRQRRANNVSKNGNLMAVLALAVMVAFSFFSSNTITSQFATFNNTTRIRVPSPIELIEIPLNVNSSFVQSDISKIVHIPSINGIQVHLKPERRCQNPLLQGRISGWSLSMIEFGDLNGDIVEGQYDISQMPMSGQYSVEILVVVCKKYGGGEDYRSIHLKDDAYCLEVSDDDSHQLTAGGTGMEGQAMIYLQVPSGRDNGMGRWIHNSLLAKGSVDLLDEEDILQLPQPEPVFTPHQCTRNPRKEFKAFCEAISTKRRANIYKYTYQWNPKTNEKLRKDGLTGFLPATSDHRLPTDYGDTNICFVGASHSRYLSEGCQTIVDRTKQLAIQQKLNSSLVDNVKCNFLEIRFPSVDEIPIDVELHRKLDPGNIGMFGNNNCTHVVLGLFQWYVSQVNPFVKELTFHKWKVGMIKTVQDIQEFAKSSPSSRIRQIYLRSAHANGFKRDAKRCPIIDARTPWNAELTTSIVMEIVDELRSNATTSSTGEGSKVPPVSFLDSRFLLDPVWDSASDWCHYPGYHNELESQFFLSKILAGE